MPSATRLIRPKSLILFCCTVAAWTAGAPLAHAEPSTVDLPLCRLAGSLPEQHTGQYQRDLSTLQLPPRVRYRSPSLTTFLQEPSDQVRLRVGEGSAIERVYDVRCRYGDQPSAPGVPPTYSGESYLTLVAPTRAVTDSDLGRTQLLQLSDYAAGQEPTRVSATVDLGNAGVPTSAVDRVLPYRVTLELWVCPFDSSDWTRLPSRTYSLESGARRTLSVSHGLLPGYHRIKLVVSAHSPSSKPMALNLHAVRLAVRDR